MAKFVILTACYLVASIILGGALEVDEFKAHLKAAAQVCQGETGGTDADIEDILNNRPAGSMEGKCLHACVMRQFGLMDANGKLDRTFALEFAKQCANGDAELLKKGIEMVELCTAIEVSDNPCESIEQYKTCIRETSQALHISDMEF